VFTFLFRENAMKVSRDALVQRAESMSAALSNLSGNGSGGMGMGGGMGAYVRFLDEIAMTDVWIVDQDLALISAGHMTAVTYSDLPQDAESVVARVFTGETTVSESFSGLFGTPTITVGTPISSNGAVTGALLLHAAVSGTDRAMWQGLAIMGVSLSVALVLSVVLSAALAIRFTRPLARMEEASVRLAGGAHGVKTGISQPDEIGRLAGAIDQLSDRLEEAAGERARLEEARRDFIASISHELRTPVTVLRGSLEALCDGVISEPVQVEEYHCQMLAETVSLQRLVNDLMDLTRLENADFPIERTEVDLGSVLGDAARAARGLAVPKGIEVRVKIAAPARMTGDYGRLRQMLLIVLDNAVKYAPENSAVDAALEGDRIVVSDQGPGIPATDLPRIFDRFYRASNAAKSAGSGLGLAIAGRIAARHGIEIRVTSVEGEGTRFEFLLPRGLTHK
jgi:signal transduction histidine kinase